MAISLYKTHLVRFQKALHGVSRSQHCLKIQSLFEAQGNLVIVNDILPTYSGAGHTWDTPWEYQTKARLKLRRGNSQSCSSVSSVQGLRWLRPSSFPACKSRLSLGLVPFSVCRLPWQVSHSSGLWNSLQSSHVIWASPSRFHTMAAQSFSQVFMRGLPASHCLALVARSLTMEGDFTASLLIYPSWL